MRTAGEHREQGHRPTTSGSFRKNVNEYYMSGVWRRKKPVIAGLARPLRVSVGNMFRGRRP
jgi:hypothetical protein